MNQESREKILNDCSEDEKKILELLREPISKEELIQKLDMPTHNVNILLSTMEIKGLIIETYGEVRINI